MSYLPVNDFVGHDNKIYRDLAVEATPQDTLLVWVRRRFSDGKYFLVTSIVGGHVLRKEVTAEEAIAVYHSLADKVAYKDAFAPIEKLRKARSAAMKKAAVTAKKPKAKTKDTDDE